jgi:radical SAM superfamily enzyme YgiQ (UPF0313 family)
MLVLWPVHQLEHEHAQYPGIMNLSAVLKRAGIRSEVIATDEARIVERIDAEERVVLAYSTPSALAKTYIDLNQRLKARRPDAVSVFGGAHPTYFPEMIEQEGVDGVCIGEGEYAMLDLVRAVRDGRWPKDLENWWIKENGEVYRNPVRPLIENLDELPLPDREVFIRAVPSAGLHAIVMTSRGCPYGCTYCYNHLYQDLYAGKGRLIRRRSVEHVLQELRFLKDEGFRFIRFMDDLFTLDPKWIREFSRRYPDEIGLPFSCMVRANFIDDEVVSDLKKAGCHRIMMGIEAGNERLRNEILNRRMSDREILDAARIIRSSGIRLVTANILAVPGGTLDNDWETVDLNIRARSNYGSASILQPFPGTKIHRTAEVMGLLEDDHVAALSDGGFGYASTLKIGDRRDQRQVENLHKFFPLLIWMPWLRPVVRQLIKLPPNRLFNLIYIACVNIGIHFISVSPSVGAPMLVKKVKQRFLPRRRKSAAAAETPIE